MDNYNLELSGPIVLQKLLDHKNILLTGAPGTGKTRLMSEVISEFLKQPQGAPYLPNQEIALPASGNGIIGGSVSQNPKHKVFRIVLSGSSKQKDLLTGISPKISDIEESAKFQVEVGALVAAANHALQPGFSSLLVIDELNRGPAVEVFGPAISAIESSKRLLEDGTAGPDTQYFRILGVDGQPQEFALPPRLYILGAMNQADVSVASLDTAFLRRWYPIRLEPDYIALHTAIRDKIGELSSRGREYVDLVLAAWKELNKVISVTKGPEHQLGQGLLIGNLNITNEGDLERFGQNSLIMFIQHIQEVFFGDNALIGHLLGAGDDKSPFVLDREVILGRTFEVVKVPTTFSPGEVESAFRAIGRL